MAPHATASAIAALDKAALPPRVMIDCSHANSGKDHVRQAQVAAEIAATIRTRRAAGHPPLISGVMLESFLEAGAQSLDTESPDPQPLVYGKSVTDKCMDWETSARVLADLARS